MTARIFTLMALVSLPLCSCAADTLEYVIVNESAVLTTPKRVVLFPFIIEEDLARSESCPDKFKKVELNTGRFEGGDIGNRGTEAKVVVRDELEPYFLNGMADRLTIAGFVPPEVTGAVSIKKKLNDELYCQAVDILETYAHHSAVDADSLKNLIQEIDAGADGIIFLRIDGWRCTSRVEIPMRAYFFLKDSLKAAWVAQDKTWRETERDGLECTQQEYASEGKQHLTLFLDSMPFQRMRPD